MGGRTSSSSELPLSFLSRSDVCQSASQEVASQVLLPARRSAATAARAEEVKEGPGTRKRRLSVLLALVALLLWNELACNAHGADDDAGPVQGGELVAFEENRKEHREDLPCGGDARHLQGAEVGDGEEDEGLARCRARCEEQDLGQDGRVLHDEAVASEGLPSDGGDNHRDQHHVEVGPEHEVVGLGLHVLLLLLLLQP
mmetsp:Transcript_34833/g.81350  ORF Transcript_34833/g.81350 Transcript_34833/m.81350 type:complete len:200 (+) Transcript_34833:63-662(+)